MPFASLNGTQIHYLQQGFGEPLLLLHGLGCSSYDWEYQLPAFSARYRVIAPCLRGFGASEKPQGPYSIAEYCDDALALLAHLNVRRAHVVGFSMGGAIGFQMAVSAPKRISSLIAVNSQPTFELDDWRKHLLVLSRVGMASVLGMQRMSRLLAKQLFPLAEQQHLRKVMVERHSRNHKASYLAAVQALAGWSVRDRIGQLPMPVLMLSAEHDFVPASARRMYAQSMPDGRLETIADSRHATPFDQPRVFNERVLSFVDEVASRERLPQVG